MSNSNLSVKIGKLKLRNPVIVASGTFGYAEEFASLIDLKKIGAIITKTITLKPRQGNPPPRTCETASGMLNAIGLENPGIDKFIKEKLPSLLKIGVPIIVSIAAETPEELTEMVRYLDSANVNALELNLSCPNVKREKFIGLKPNTLISQHKPWTRIFVSSARRATKKTLIAKLSPNVTDITEIALAAEDAGCDAVSLVNTFLALAIDVNSRKPKLANITGGLSGPAIKPIALRMVWEVAKLVKIPIIGGGGIMNTRDALEFIIAGACAVSVGTATFLNPKAALEIIEGLKYFMQKENIRNINNLIGSLRYK